MPSIAYGHRLLQCWGKNIPSALLLRSILTKNIAVRHLILFSKISCMAKSWVSETLKPILKHRGILNVVVDLAVWWDMHFSWYELTSTVLISTRVFTVVTVLTVLRITEITLYDACLVNSFRRLTVLRAGRFNFVESVNLGRSVWFSMHYMAVWYRKD